MYEVMVKIKKTNDPDKIYVYKIKFLDLALKMAEQYINNLGSNCEVYIKKVE